MLLYINDITEKLQRRKSPMPRRRRFCAVTRSITSRVARRRLLLVPTLILGNGYEGCEVCVEYAHLHVSYLSTYIYGCKIKVEKHQFSFNAKCNPSPLSLNESTPRQQYMCNPSSRRFFISAASSPPHKCVCFLKRNKGKGNKKKQRWCDSRRRTSTTVFLLWQS